MNGNEKYKEALREFMVKYGEPAKVDQEKEYDWERVNYYGWHDFDSFDHLTNCKAVIPDGAKLKEYTYSMFAGTFVDSDDEVGVEVYPVHCECGELENITLRYVGSFGDVIQKLINVETPDPRLKMIF